MSPARCSLYSVVGVSCISDFVVPESSVSSYVVIEVSADASVVSATCASTAASFTGCPSCLECDASVLDVFWYTASSHA